MTTTPVFVGRHALVLHRAGDTTIRLTRQLGLLGLAVTTRWGPLNTHDLLVFVDADAGGPGLLPWAPGPSPVPLVALLGSEAPGRVAWALDAGAHAIMAKPVTAAAVYPALLMAQRRHAEAAATAARIATLEERLRLQPLVLRAVAALVAGGNGDEAAALRHLRQTAMRHRQPLEQVAAAILANRHAWPEAG